MHKLLSKKFVPAFTQALLLVVLMNLSGHMFLHLGDANIEHEGSHISAHSEQKTISAPLHQCSACKDHQTLSLENTATATIQFTAESLTEKRWQQLQVHSFTASFNPTRGPPQR